MELYDLNSSLNNFFESSYIKGFFVNFLIDSLICLCISFMALKILKISSSGLILINSQPIYLSNPFCLCLYLCLYDPFHQLPLLIFIHENKDQFYSLRHCIEFVYFLVQMHPLLILILIGL